MTVVYCPVYAWREFGPARPKPGESSSTSSPLGRDSVEVREGPAGARRATESASAFLHGEVLLASLVTMQEAATRRRSCCEPPLRCPHPARPARRRGGPRAIRAPRTPKTITPAISGCAAFVLRALPVPLRPDRVPVGGDADELGAEVGNASEYGRPVLAHLLASAERAIRVRRLNALVVVGEQGDERIDVVRVHRRVETLGQFTPGRVRHGASLGRPGTRRPRRPRFSTPGRDRLDHASRNVDEQPLAVGEELDEQAVLVGVLVEIAFGADRPSTNVETASGTPSVSRAVWNVGLSRAPSGLRPRTGSCSRGWGPARTTSSRRCRRGRCRHGGCRRRRRRYGWDCRRSGRDGRCRHARCRYGGCRRRRRRCGWDCRRRW